MILNLKQYPVNILFPKNKAYTIDSEVCELPFSEALIEQLTQLGDFLMSKGRSVPSIVAAGYWLRKSHLQAIKKQYPVSRLQAKGFVFHIAPGNVDTLFFYSMIISVLCGNQTLLRISNKLSDDALTLLQLLNQFFEHCPDNRLICSLLTVIQYPYNDAITKGISSTCNARVIWGGDETIAHISQFQLANKSATNLCFPDRYSVAVIQIETESQVKEAVENLLRDIKPYFQQACSSPKVVYWLNTAHSLQEAFWQLLDEQLKVDQRLEATDLISQLLYIQRLPLLINDKKININGCLLKKHDLLHVAQVESLTLDSIKYHPGLWVLLNLQINSLADIKLFRHCQTVTVFGIAQEHWQYWQSMAEQPMKRVVSSGQALAFSHVWDGIDLVDSLTH